jgi:hypothetical protein
MDVEVCARPLDHLDEWERIFSVLVKRHSISGLRRFSRRAFAQQLATPGMVMFRASQGSQTIGFDLWYVQGDIAQSHLAAFDETGYKVGASYATKWTMLDYMSRKVSWVNLGAGTHPDATDGLSYFKRGFSTGTKEAWLCNRIFQPENYSNLAMKAASPAGGAYFPAYRVGEFG